MSTFEPNPEQTPPVLPPPQFDLPGGKPHEEPTPNKNGKKKLGGLAALGMAILAKLKTIGLFLLSAFKYLKLSKVLLTSGSMLISIALYSIAFGWKFAVGFVLCIFIHEMGHVLVGYMQGLPMSAPVFIPFMGAVIFNKRGNSSAWAQAIMGIGGPVAGTVAGLICWAFYFATGNVFFLALAYVTFFMNLFNMTPMVPLDGGWITLAVSPYLWLLGLLALIYMFIFGGLHNPLVIIIVIMAIPRLWQGLRTGNPAMGMEPATIPQRWIMGICYVALGGFLFLCMKGTGVEEMMNRRPAKQVALLSHRMPVERRVAAGSKVLELPLDIGKQAAGA